MPPSTPITTTPAPVVKETPLLAGKADGCGVVSAASLGSGIVEDVCDVEGSVGTTAGAVTVTV